MLDVKYVYQLTLRIFYSRVSEITGIELLYLKKVHK
jgi:hypothetical protein